MRRSGTDATFRLRSETTVIARASFVYLLEAPMDHSTDKMVPRQSNQSERPLRALLTYSCSSQAGFCGVNLHSVPTGAPYPEFTLRGTSAMHTHHLVTMHLLYQRGVANTSSALCAQMRYIHASFTACVGRATASQSIQLPCTAEHGRWKTRPYALRVRCTTSALYDTDAFSRSQRSPCSYQISEVTASL